ncbi:MAG TPA: DUF4215 domain-containing protein [Candidatus Nanoarchaeia archaeon]|nr:DUF4215 domain-containing protein [Candidatus Nanoarchaeia archaeon]
MVIKNTMRHHTLKGVVCNSARVLDASNFRKSENCGTKICKNPEQISCAQDSNSTLKCGVLSENLDIKKLFSFAFFTILILFSINIAKSSSDTESSTAVIQLVIESSVSFCGNGILEGTEGCDDNNTVSGDGCSNVCEEEVISAVGGGGRKMVEEEEEIENFSVDKTSFNIVSYRNELKIIKFSVKNLGTNLSKFSFSSNLDFVFIQEEVYIGPGEEKEIEVKIYSPKKPGIYEGKIIVNYEGIEKELPITLEIIESPALFDIGLKILLKSKFVTAGNDVFAEAKLVNLGESDRTIGINYYITDSSRILSNATEQISVLAGEELKLIRKLSLPQNITSGTYNFYLDLTYDDVTLSAKDKFNVVEWQVYLIAGIVNAIAVIPIGLIIILKKIPLAAGITIVVAAVLAGIVIILRRIKIKKLIRIFR